MSRYSDFTDRTIRCLNAALYLGYDVSGTAPAKVVAGRLLDLQEQIIRLEHEGPDLREFAGHGQSPPPPLSGVASESHHGIALGLAKWVCMDVLLAAYDDAGTCNLKSIPSDKSDLPERIQANWPAVSAALKRTPEVNLAALHTALRHESAREERAAEGGDDYYMVTLAQAAAVVSRSKRTLEGWVKDDSAFPVPDVEGGSGRPNEWKWSRLRPYLEDKTGRKLPKRFPSDTLRPDFGTVEP